MPEPPQHMLPERRSRSTSHNGPDQRQPRQQPHSSKGPAGALSARPRPAGLDSMVDPHSMPPFQVRCIAPSHPWRLHLLVQRVLLPPPALCLQQHRALSSRHIQPRGLGCGWTFVSTKHSRDALPCSRSSLAVRELHDVPCRSHKATTAIQPPCGKHLAAMEWLGAHTCTNDPPDILRRLLCQALFLYMLPTAPCAASRNSRTLS